MDLQKLLDQITQLSLRDTKTLSQKGLKASEEVGELARAILPLEGAHGTNHRLPSTDKVVEECADMILVAYSIAASLGLTIEDFAKVLARKADYWEFLLDNEDKADLDNLNFEIHITVKEAELGQFEIDCGELGVKPIVLDLYTSDTTILDIMTSSRFIGSTRDVTAYTKNLGRELRARGYNVVREKIETVPWHPAAQIKPQRPSAYFEAHIAFKGSDPEKLRSFASKNNIHLSRNAMKKGDDVVMMGTYRVDATDITSQDFNDHVIKLCEFASEHGFEIKKPHTEYSLFDTNQNHDGEWVRG